MRRAALAAALLGVLALPGAAWGHASLSFASPGVQSRVERAPGAVSLALSQGVTATPRAIEVFSADGRKVSGPATVAASGRLVRAPVRGVHDGAYTVRWRVTSSDGHTAAGVFTFGVGVAAPPPSEAVGSAGPGWGDDLVRWLYFAALAVLLGALGVRLLVLRGPLPSRLELRLQLLAGVGALAVLNVGVAAFVLRAEDALQLPFTELLYGDLSPLATKTRFGIAFIVMTLAYAAVAALVYLAWLLDRPRLLGPAFVVALAFASGLSLSGHSALEPNASWLSQAADWVHLVAGSLWAGGLLALVLAVWPAGPELRRRAFLGFSRLATVLIGAIVLAGTYLGILRLPELGDLWTTSYGRTLLVKLALVSVALAWGALHHFVVRPRLERGGVPADLRRSLVGESAVAMAVLLVAAVLVNSAPPPPDTPAGPAQATTVPR